MPAAPPNHHPARYSLLVSSVADLEAMTSSFDTGDLATILDAVNTEFVRFYIYDRDSTLPTDGLTVLNGPGGVGRWQLNQLNGSYTLTFVVSGASIIFNSSSDPSLDATTVTISKIGTGVFDIVFAQGSVIRPTAGAAIIDSVSATANTNVAAAASALFDGAHTVRVNLTHIGLDGAASSAANYDLTLLVSVR